MEDLEKQIEEAAEKFALLPNLHQFNGRRKGFIKGAKSPEAKQYWTDIIYKEIIENETFFDFASKCASKKYEVGSKEYAIATISIKFGMGCSLTKQYWQQGMYSEEEVKRLCSKAWLIKGDINDLIYQFDNWFDRNKKK